MPGTMEVLIAIVGVIIVLIVTAIVVSELDTSITKTDYAVNAQTAINKSVAAGYTAVNIGSIVPLVMIFGLIMAALGYFGR